MTIFRMVDNDITNILDSGFKNTVDLRSTA